MSLEDIGRRLTRKYIQNKEPYEYDGGWSVLLFFVMCIILTILSIYIYYSYEINSKGDGVGALYIFSTLGLGCLFILVCPIFYRTNPFYLIWFMIKAILVKLGSKT